MESTTEPAPPAAAEAAWLSRASSRADAAWKTIFATAHALLPGLVLLEILTGLEGFDALSWRPDTISKDPE